MAFFKDTVSGSRESPPPSIDALQRDSLRPTAADANRRPPERPDPRAEMRAEGCLPLHGLNNRRMAMAQEKRAMPTVVINVLIAVYVPFAWPDGVRAVDRKRVVIA